MKAADLAGMKFGRLTVVKFSERKKNHNYWVCQCDCGNIVTLGESNLKRQQNCGCISKEKHINQMVGKKFGMITVLSFAKSEGGHYYYNCQCDCGNKKVMRNNTIKIAKSCGCYRLDKMTKHNECKKRLYRIWIRMRSRCFNLNNHAYEEYGGRGITVCKEWLKSYEEFRDWALSHGYADNLTIDRIDVNGNYEPSNCRWATMKVQSNNKRNNKLLTFNGVTHTAAQWSDILGYPRRLIYVRLHRGWTVEKTLSSKPQIIGGE
jgi:hypothetical protein